MDITNSGPLQRGPFLSVSQVEERHPGVKGKVRRFVHAADHGDPEYRDLSAAIVRIGRGVIIDEARFVQWLISRAARPNAPARNPHGRAGKPANRREQD